MPDIALPLLIAVMLTIALRLLPRVVRPGAVDPDTWYHLLAAERIRQGRFRLPTHLPGFLIPLRYDYPPLYHCLLALFPLRTRRGIEPCVSAIIDGLHAVIAFALAYDIAAHAVPRLSAQPSTDALIAAMLFASYPALVSVATGPRAFQATPRPLGELFLTLCFFLALRYLITGNSLWMVPAVLAGALLLLTSKFAAQALLFVSLFMTLWSRTWLFLFLTGASALTAMVVSGGHYARVLVGHVEHSQYYRKWIGKSHIVTRARRGSGKNAPVAANRPRNLRGLLQSLYYNTPLTAMLLRNPALLLLGVVLVLRKPTVDHVAYLLGWIVGCLSLFALTSLEPFLFLGEAERYVEYCTVPVCALLAVLVAERDGVVSWSLLGAVFTYSLLSLVFNYILFAKINARSDSDGLSELVSWLTRLPEPRRIVPVPANLLGYALACNTAHEVLFFAGNLREHVLKGDDFARLFPAYPFVTNNVRWLVSQWGIDMLVCSKKGLSQAARYGVVYDLSTYEVVFENERFLACRVPSSVPQEALDQRV